MLAEWLEERFGASVTWMPFDLHPEYPPEGIPRAQLTARYGEEGRRRVQQMFEASGLAYNPPPEVVPNSLRALRLAELARERGCYEAMHGALMHAYWEEGVDIGNPAVLRDLAAEAGLPRTDVAVLLAGDAYADTVRRSTENAHAIGISGIPAFLLDRKLLVLGAQPREAFEQAFARLAEPAGDAPAP